jgi:DNA-binding MarR family transcriptional regulator
MSLSGESGGSWTLLTGHGHVLVEIARNPEARIRDIATAAGITERTTQAIVADLEAAGYITRTRTGRRTRYSVNPDSIFRHPAQEGLRVGPFLDLLATAGTAPHLGQRTGKPGDRLGAARDGRIPSPGRRLVLELCLRMKLTSVLPAAVLRPTRE